MGTYLNPGNGGFAEILDSGYIDKTGMIDLVNRRIGTTDNLICISRPRRFGKSYAARMLCAYYDHTCDSHGLFDDKAVGISDKYEKHINKYNVVYLDISGIISLMMRREVNIKNISRFIASELRKELIESYPTLERIDDVTACLVECVKLSKKQFVFIIDEWDAVIREAKDDSETQKAYLNLLREWFKNGNVTSQIVAVAYMTGILPIKKDGSESAISDFDEYSVLDTQEFAPYTGFIEDEVKTLCEESGMDYLQMKEWYDGYTYGNYHNVYNPYSVMQAIKRKSFKSYWRKTPTPNMFIFTSINPFKRNI